MSKKDLAKLEDLTGIMKQIFASEFDPDSLVEDACQKLEQFLGLDDVSEEEKKAVGEIANEAVNKVLPIFALENHLISSQTVSEYFRPMVVEVAKQLTKEYGANTPSERALVGMVASAYGRYMEYSYLFTRARKAEFLTNERNGYYRNFSVEADRAFRHFQSSLTMLRQMKAPSLNVTVKASTAFVAQNQQLNTEVNTAKPNVYENNVSK